MPTITPTIGHVVWFHPASNSTHHGFAPNEICAAIIAKVLPDGKLNLGVLDGDGASHSMPGVTLIQDGEKPPKDGYYAEWMPYQKGQAAKTEEVIKSSATSQPPSPFSQAATPVK